MKLTKTQFTTCCGKAPAEALEYAASIMDEDLFKKCAEAEPWVAVKLCADWLTDGELVRHTAGRGKAVSTLLEYEPAHQLKFRLGSLFGRLDPDVEVVVARAIAPAI